MTIKEIRYICAATKAENFKDVNIETLRKKIKALKNNYKQSKKEALLVKIELLEQAEKRIEETGKFISEKDLVLLQKEIRLKYRNSANEDKSGLIASLSDRKIGYGYLFSEAEIKQLVNKKGKDLGAGSADFYEVLTIIAESPALKKEMEKVINRILRDGEDANACLKEAPVLIKGMKKECDTARRGGNPLPEEKAVTLWEDRILPCIADVPAVGFTYILNLLKNPEIAEIINPDSVIDEENYGETLELIGERTACENSEKLLRMYAKLFRVSLPKSEKQDSKGVGVKEVVGFLKYIADLRVSITEEYKEIMRYKDRGSLSSIELQGFLKSKEEAWHYIATMIQAMDEYITEYTVENPNFASSVLNDVDATKKTYSSLCDQIEYLKNYYTQIKHEERESVKQQQPLMEKMLDCEREAIGNLQHYADNYNACIQCINKKSWVKLSYLLSKMKKTSRELAEYANNIPSLLNEYDNSSVKVKKAEYEERIESIKNNYEVYCRISKERAEWENQLRNRKIMKYVRIVDVPYIAFMLVYGFLLLNASIPINPAKRILLGIVVPGIISVAYMSWLCLTQDKKVFVADQWIFVAVASGVMMLVSHAVGVFMSNDSINLPALYAVVGGLIITVVVVLIGNVVNMVMSIWKK